MITSPTQGQVREQSSPAKLLVVLRISGDTLVKKRSVGSDPTSCFLFSQILGGGKVGDKLDCKEDKGTDVANKTSFLEKIMERIVETVHSYEYLFVPAL